MGETGRDEARRPRPGRIAPTSITVSVDVTMQLALAVLTTDGTAAGEAIREAVIDAAAFRARRRSLAEGAREGAASERRPLTKPKPSGPDGNTAPRIPRREVRFTAEEAAALREWTARQVANAPPLSACQAYVLRAAFVDGRVVRGCKALEGSDGRPSDGHRRLAECRAPDCLSQHHDDE